MLACLPILPAFVVRLIPCRFALLSRACLLYYYGQVSACSYWHEKNYFDRDGAWPDFGEMGGCEPSLSQPYVHQPIPKLYRMGQVRLDKKEPLCEGGG